MLDLDAEDSMGPRVERKRVERVELLSLSNSNSSMEAAGENTRCLAMVYVQMVLPLGAVKVELQILQF